MKAPSHAQAERQRVRDRSGRYEEISECEACGKSAGLDYGSRIVPEADTGPNGDAGLVVCARKRCPASTLSDAEWAELLISKYGRRS